MPYLHVGTDVKLGLVLLELGLSRTFVFAPDVLFSVLFISSDASESSFTKKAD